MDMGFGKWIVGGVCAVGAVIAAPVVLPVAGVNAAVAALGVGGGALAAGGLGTAAASAASVAATAAVAGTAGTAGVKMAGAYEKHQEEKELKAFNRGAHSKDDMMNEMKKAQDKERQSWKEKDKNRDEVIRKQDEQLEMQDRIIIWNEVKKILQKKYQGTEIYEKYIEDTELYSETEDSVSIRAICKEDALYIKENCSKQIKDAVEQIYGCEMKITYGYR